MLGVSSQVYKKAYKISAGQKQRVSILRDVSDTQKMSLASGYPSS